MILDVVYFAWGVEVALIVPQSILRDGGNRLYHNMIQQEVVANDLRVSGVEVIEEYSNGNVLVVLSLHII